ncbi:MAG: PAS domain S-box protein [Cytophagaceae bacterium]|nr:PAS domain S-box protein [Cytophagaceae bacterium]
MARKSTPSADEHPTNPVPKKPVPLVAIGGSAGGLEAISELLRHLSPTLGMAYVYVQHLDPDHESMLTSILGRLTTMPVREAQHEMHIRPNEVYIIPPNKDLEVVDGVLTLMPRPPRPHVHLSIDRFFVSLAERQREGAIAVVLSGMASDGTLGLRAIKLAGGFTFAQDSSARFQSMPKSAIAEGVVDMVLAPAAIAQAIERLSQNPDLFHQPELADPEADAEPADPADNPEEAGDDADLRAILQILLKGVGVDFQHYKLATIRRRIARRMVLLRFKTLSDYAQHLRQHTAEVGALYSDLLINVTRFFRDPDTLDYLRKTILPRLVREKPPREAIRIWVPACSTGEEAYSLAMLLTEALGDAAATMPFQVFATDLSEAAIAKARLGTYSRAELADVSPKRLHVFFTKTDDQYRIVKSIREACVFAPHNLFKDPPFSRLDLVSCCNLLIYLGSRLQAQAIATFHYALNPGGYLVLGKSETVGASTALFSQVEKPLKLYARKNEVVGQLPFQTSRRPPDGSPTKESRPPPKAPAAAPIPPPIDLEGRVDALLLSQYVPASVVINQDLDIVHFRGSTGLFLEPLPGKASLNLLKMARPALVLALRTLVGKAQKSGEAARKTGVEFKVKGQTHHVSIEAVPLGHETMVLVLFEETAPPVAVETRPSLAHKRRIRQLEDEVALALDDVRTLIEQHEISTEELQSANEEVVSSNEELQSINEELETSKEEIESSNEELISINQELQVRNDQLNESYQYAEAIFGTIREATLVLDASLRVRSANRAFYRTFKVEPEETEGRLIYELGNGQWKIPALRELLEDIIPTHTYFQGFEVTHTFTDIGEKVMLLNARRVQQESHRREMILLAIEDITEYRRAQRLVEEREVWLRDMANNAPVLIWVAGADGLCNFLNNTWLEYSGRTMAEEVGQGWAAHIHPDDRTPYLTTFTAHFKSRQPYRTEYRLRRHDGEYRWMLEDGKPMTAPDGTLTGFMGTAAEVHDQKLLNEELERRVQQRTQSLREANADLERSNEELRQYAYVASHDLQEPLRKIVTFSKRLEQTNAEVLTKPGQEYLGKITAAAQRMTRLIDELLDFSRTVRQDLKFEPTNLNEILQDVLQDFDLIIAEKGATVEADDLPTLEAMPLQMTQLLHNLLSNALKFVAPDRPPVIRISARRPTAEEVAQRLPQADPAAYWQLTVQDNGIGFDPSFSEQIFSIFQRLHGKAAYEGTGIGLALCRRIANNHGGEIFAESIENEETTFHVLLRERQDTE